MNDAYRDHEPIYEDLDNTEPVFVVNDDAYEEINERNHRLRDIFRRIRLF